MHGTRPPCLALPRPASSTKGSRDDVESNSRFYERELRTPGTPRTHPHGRPPGTTQSPPRRPHGWSPKSAIGHLEGANNNAGPCGCTTAWLRADVAERLTHPASGNPVRREHAAGRGGDSNRLDGVGKVLPRWDQVFAVVTPHALSAPSIAAHVDEQIRKARPA